METILRFLRPRTFAGLAALAAAVVLIDRFQGYPRYWWMRRRYAAERATRPEGADIARALDAAESRRLRALHRQVVFELESARARGFDVARLRRIADSALSLDAPAYRRAAIERLNKLRLAIPQSTEPFRPAGVDEEPAGGLPTPRSSAGTRGR